MDYELAEILGVEEEEISLVMEVIEEYDNCQLMDDYLLVEL